MIDEIKEKKLSREELLEVKGGFLKNYMDIGGKRIEEKSAIFTEDTRFSIECSLCKIYFAATSKENLLYNHKIYVFSKEKKNYQKRLWWRFWDCDTYDLTWTYGEIIEYIGDCPNCHHKKILCYEATGNEVTGNTKKIYDTGMRSFNKK
jgi:hypothetical protein